MPIKIILCLWIMVVILAFAPLQHAHAANLDMYLHFYIVDGVTVGEFSLGDHVAFRLRVAKEGAMPVISMQKGNEGAVISPDVTNGMFMIRLLGNGD